MPWVMAATRFSSTVRAKAPSAPHSPIACVVTDRPPTTHVLLILIVGVAALALLVYFGIALPAVWSAKSARRKAAATVLHQILNACIGGENRIMPDRAPADQPHSSCFRFFR